MKITGLIFLNFLAFLSGCASIEMASRPKAINGENCIASPRMQVSQVLGDGVLARICPIDYPSYYSDAFEACVVKGDMAFMAVAPKTNDYVDNQKITLTKTQCFVANGTYSYPRKDGFNATVRNVKIVEDTSAASGTKQTP